MPRTSWFCRKYPRVCEIIPGIAGNNPYFYPAEPQLSADLRQKLQTLEDELETGGQPDPSRVLEIAEALRNDNRFEIAQVMRQAIPRLVQKTDPTNTPLLRQAMEIQAQSLEALGRSVEADAVFAIVGHLDALGLQERERGSN